MWGGGQANKKILHLWGFVLLLKQRDGIQQAQLFLACCCLRPCILNSIHI